MFQPFYATQRAPKGHTTVMKVGRFTASLMRAPRLVGECIHGLPMGEQVPCYSVDSLPGCPDDWVRGEGSYVCPVSEDWGLWFSFTSNDYLNTAVLTSVKGMNPITGQKIGALKLEKYDKTCPVHEVAFQGSERFCEACGFKWPAQSYVAPPNISWLDGWRQADGTVRQFFFTEDEDRDVASAVIGEKNTVPAFGFAFFEPKVRREAPPAPVYRTSQIYGGFSGVSGCSGCAGPSGVSGPSGHAEKQYQKMLEKALYEKTWKSKSPFILEDYANLNYNKMTFTGHDPDADMQYHVTNSASGSYQTVSNVTSPDSLLSSNSGKTLISDNGLPRYERDPLSTAFVISRRGAVPDENAKVSVGAGARISQDIVIDPLNASDWKDEASGIIRLYFVFEGKFNQILSKGFKDIEGSSEGFLKGVPVG